MWAQHGHTQCVRDPHLLGDLHVGHTPTMKILHSDHEIASVAVFGHKYHSSNLYACFMSA